MRPTARGGFTLIEVIVSLLIASVAVSYLGQGLAISVLAEERQQFFLRSARFLDQGFEAEMIRAARSGSILSGAADSGFPALTYRIEPEPSTEVQNLVRIKLTLLGQGRRAPHRTELITYYCDSLRALKPEAGDDGTAGAGKDT